MSRLPLRLRLTLAFALVMTVVLVATGLVVYRIFRGDLDHTIDASLRARAAQLAGELRRAGPAARPAGEGEDFAQVLAAGGRLLASTPQVRGLELVPAPLRDPATVKHPPIPALDGTLRMRALPVETPAGPEIAVAGTSLGERDDSLRTLALLLAAGGAVALLLASLAGYGVASGALRPVEAMRRRAAAISSSTAGERLPVPDSADELERLARTLNQMLERLEAALLRERAFVADASHELRTPLSVLRTEIDLALRRGRSPEELRAALESAGEETDRLVQLAEDLLVLARVEDGRLALRREELDVNELLSVVAARAGQGGRAVIVDSADGLRVCGDALRLEQALGNMVDNAFRHGEGEVRLSAVARESALELHVVDQGAGIEPDFAERAFERFTRGDDARSRGGAGLGLAIAAAVAASHGGRAAARGADVWIALPAQPCENDTSVLRSSPPLSVRSSTVPTPRR